MKIPYREKSGHFQNAFFSFYSTLQLSQVSPLFKKNPKPKTLNTSTVLIDKDLHMKILLGRQITWLGIARAPKKMK